MTSRTVFARVRGAYRVPPGHAAPETVRRRLDAVARERLPAACARALADALDPHDPSVWVLRRIDSASVVDLARSDDEIGATWATDIAGAVVRAVAVGAADTAMRFEDADAHAAAFAAELATGRAWSAWYFEPFSDLRALPRSAALRETILRRGTGAVAVLTRLARANTLDVVVIALDDADAEAVLDAVATELGPPARPDRALVERLAALAAAAAVPSAPESPPRATLRLAGAALGEPRLAGPALVAAASVVAATPRSGPGDVPPAVPAWFALGEVPPAIPAWPTPARRHPLSGGDEARDDGDRPPRAPRLPHRVPAPAAVPAPLVTSFGGAFLLLEALLELPAGLHGDAALRQLLLRKCLGAAADPDAVAERGLLLACGLDAAPPDDALAGRDPGDDVASLRERLVALGRATGTRVRLDDAGGAVVARDADTGAWLAAGLAERGSPLLLEPGSELVTGAPSPWLPPVDADLDHLAGGAAEPAWAVIARAVLDGFARRLPGMARSSAPFLWRNLLAGTAVVRMRADAIEVEIAPRPLDVALRLGGYHGLEIRPPWLEGGCVRISLSRDS